VPDFQTSIYFSSVAMPMAKLPTAGRNFTLYDQANDIAALLVFPGIQLTSG
jgi:hypothetical protein